MFTVFRNSNWLGRLVILVGFLDFHPLSFLVYKVLFPDIMIDVDGDEETDQLISVCAFTHEPECPFRVIEVNKMSYTLEEDEGFPKGTPVVITHLLIEEDGTLAFVDYQHHGNNYRGTEEDVYVPQMI